MPGGDLAAREPWRAAAAYLRTALGEDAAPVRARLLAAVPRESLALVERMLERRLNSPLSSGAGRAFDAAASLILGRHRSAYEGQGPLELEQVALRAGPPSRLSPFPWRVKRERPPWRIDLAPAFARLAAELLEGSPRAPELAYRFHLTVASAVCEAAEGLGGSESIADCCLCGGVFQNQILLRLVTEELERAGFRVYRNRDLPCNDGGISYGQVVLASWRAFEGEPGDGGTRAGTARRARRGAP